MNDQVSVEEALAAGRKQVINPAIGIGIGAFIVAAAAVILMSGITFFVFVFAALFACVIALVFYCRATIKWRIWAFSNVTNVHELKRAAIAAQIMNPDDSWLEQLAIRSAEDKQKLKDIAQRFTRPDVFIDDFTIPSEVSVYASLYSYVNIGVSLIIFGLLMLLINIYWAFGIIAVGIGIIAWSRQAARNTQNRKAILTFNDAGITTPITGYLPWEQISNEVVFFQRMQNAASPGSRKNEYYVLRFDHPGGTETINLSNLAVKPVHLDHILYVYRNRYEAFKNRGKAIS